MSRWSQQRIAVIGGAGFVGTNLVRLALREGCQRVVIVDNLLSSELATIPQDSRVEFVQGSIADDRTLKQLQDQYDYLFHLATFHGNQNSIADPLQDHANNLLTTLKLYEHLKTFRQLKRVVYAASGCTLAPHTYETPEPVREDGPVPLDLDSPYQISKVVGEFYSVYYHRQHGLPTVRARFQNVYGPWEVLGAGSWRGTPATIWRNVVPTFIYRGLKQLPLTVENEGKASRDFIFVEDLVEGLARCAFYGQPGNVYNLASGIETSIVSLAQTVNRLTGNPVPLVFGPRRAWDHAGRRVGSREKAQQQLGFAAQTELEAGLRETVQWTKDHLPFIDSCIVKHEQYRNAAEAGMEGRKIA